MSDEIIRRKAFIINAIYALLVIAAVAICFLTASIIMPFWVALLLAAMMQPFTRFLDKKLPVRKSILSTVVCLIFYVIIGGAIVWLISGALYLMEQAFTELPAYYNSTIKPALDSSGNFAESVLSILPAQVRPDLETINAAIAGATQNFITGLSQKGVAFAGSFVSAIPSSFLSVLITILLSFFINMQYDDVICFLKCQLPEKIRNSAGELKQLIKSSLFKYLKSTLILMLITMAELTVGFLIIRVRNPIGLAIAIAIFDALPVFGVGTVMIPWAIIELLNGNYALAVGLSVVYVIVDVMRNIWEPRIIGAQFELNPIVALVTVYAGYQLAGIFGMIGLLIAVYILLTFHKAGKIKLFNSPKKIEPSNGQEQETSHGK